MSNQIKFELKATPLQFSQIIKPSELFLAFSDTPWAMWLDSCHNNHQDSRFDIMVWQPEVTLVTNGAVTTITEKTTGISSQSKEDPLLLVEQQQKLLFEHYRITSSPLPFNGGCVGYFSYDLGRRFESLPRHAKRDINMPEMAVGIYRHGIIFDRLNQTYYLLCDDSKRVKLSLEIDNAINKATAQAPFKLTSNWQAQITKAQYIEKFNKIQQYLLDGDCYQINLTQRFSADYQGNEYQAYLALRKKNQAPFSAFIRTDQCAIASVSPERFLRVIGDDVQSKPIKGTQPRSDAIEQDNHNKALLQNSEKDRAENLMIVDLLRNDISRVCQAGTVKVPQLFAIESFPAVHHLVSTVVGKLAPQYGATDLLRASFPGGSITGAPKIRAMEIIDEIEPHRRALYCGSIGYLSICGNMDTSITIRTLVAIDQKIYCWAGGGIVADSVVDAEYQESYDKVNKILPVLEKL
ncbi:aminodeoxychorismate synthase component I [Thalassotalea ganghwensis]